LSSETSGFLSTTLRGSGTGAAGTEVIPAPRCWVRVRALPNRRVGWLPVRAEPSGVEPSRVDTALRLVPARAGPLGPLGAPGVLVGADTGADCGARSGAPHTLQ
jgi:hypothetical protein